MTPIDFPPLIDQLLRAGAALMISISGGKDSQAMLKALFRDYKNHGWTGTLLAIHAHLGRMEWPETLGEVRRQCDLLGIELLIVERPQGDFLDLMIDRMHTVAGQGVPFWPSPSARYCTSDMKRAQIDKKLRAYEIVISAEGVRADESPKRAKKPIMELRSQICASRLKKLSIEEALEQRQPGERVAIDWRPIHSWSEESVWIEIGTTLEDVNRRRTLAKEGRKKEALDGWMAHPEYALGNHRISCALCMMADRNDLQNGATALPGLPKTLIAMEQWSGFTMKNGFSLAELEAAYTDGTPLLDDITRPTTEKRQAAQAQLEAEESETIAEMFPVDFTGAVQAAFAFDDWC